jgi:hypothetical protein
LGAVIGLMLGVGFFVDTHLLVGQALAIVGRPLTPMSYAGVARRTTRRAVAAAPVGVYHW